MIPFPFQAAGAGMVQQETGGGGPTDPYWANVVALMNEGAANGATSFTDAKGNSYARAGTSVVATGISGFAGSCIYSPAANDEFHIADNTNWNLLSGGDFTVEAFVRLVDAPGGGFGANVVSRGSAISNGYILRLVDGNLQWVYPGLAAGSRAQTWATGTTYHVMACRAGTQHYLGVNGAVSAVSMSNRTTDNTGQLYIGDQPAGGTAVEYISHRVTKGVARYTSNFTPPTSWPTS